MRHKTFLLFAVLVIGLLSGPLAAGAEKGGKVYRIGWLGPTQGNVKVIFVMGGSILLD